ncbi:hypothetical protein QFZ76_005068 [Streptomyces sp. V4I2]|nr:hypothetical protein [Streptomyces sp. V4I2]
MRITSVAAAHVAASAPSGGTTASAVVHASYFRGRSAGRSAWIATS